MKSHSHTLAVSLCILGLIIGISSMIVGCSDSKAEPVITTVRARVKCTYPVVGTTIKVIRVDKMYEVGDTVEYAGVTYTILSIECPYEYGECPSPNCNNHVTQEHHIDYQLALHMDTVWIYDRDRLVGSYISNWHNQMDSIILYDNE